MRRDYFCNLHFHHLRLLVYLDQRWFIDTSAAMAKRQAEDDLGEVDECAAKRSRVDIADLLGSDGDVETHLSSKGSVQHANGDNLAQSSGENVSSNVNETGTAVNIHAQADLVGTGNILRTEVAEAPVNALMATSNGQEPKGTAVYIACTQHEHDSITDQDILGVFSDVKSANEVVIMEFLNYHRKYSDPQS